MPARQALEQLESGMQGLSRQEADRRLKQYGKNTIRERKPKAWWQVFFGQFNDLLVWILIGAAAVFGGSGKKGKFLGKGAGLLFN